jgi:crossover junction endodeoxyribonuclease RuvC
MSAKNLRILAIDPGTRKMGFAFFEHKNLLYHGVESIKSRKSPHETLREARKTILRLIKDFKPDILAVEKAFFTNNRSASLLNVFIAEIRAIGRRKRLKVMSFAPSTVKKAICGNGRASKKEVARVIVFSPLTASRATLALKAAS